MKVTQSHPMLCNPMGYSVHEILQARILEWVAMPSSRGSSWPRNQTRVFCIAGGFFTSWATREAQKSEWHLLGLKNIQEWWFLEGGGQRQVAEPRPGEQSGTEASSLLSFSLFLLLSFLLLSILAWPSLSQAPKLLSPQFRKLTGNDTLQIADS